MTGRSNKKKRKYDVGYGKPPKQTQWQKGQSGNKSGRPKKVRELTGNMAIDGWYPTALWPFTVGEVRQTFILQMLEDITVKENGEERPMRIFQALIKAIIAKAMKGDHRSQKLLLETFNTAVYDQEQVALEMHEMYYEYEMRLEEEVADVMARAREKRRAKEREEVEREMREREQKKGESDED